MALSGDEPIPPIIPSTPQYVPVFPFYEAEPTWFYKGYSTSGSDGGSGGDDDLVLLFSETITTVEQGNTNFVARLAYNGAISANTIIVTFDGTEYTCPQIYNGTYFYGGYSSENPVFTEYPFLIMFRPATQYDDAVSMIYTETAGTHTISVKVHQDDLVPLPTSPDEPVM